MADDGGRRRFGRPVIGMFGTPPEPPPISPPGAAWPAGRPVFVLGDSHTGALGLAQYLSGNGLRTKVYYIEDARQILPLHEHQAENARLFLDYVATAPADAFLDYPTRSFYRELHRHYPQASFILPVRQTTARWERAAHAASGGAAFDAASLRHAYEAVNTQIRGLFGQGQRRYLELCVDDDPADNAHRLRDFLGLSGTVALGRDDLGAPSATDALSEQFDLYPTASLDPAAAAAEVEALIAPSKGMLSERGWVFLANDANDFLRVQSGQVRWDADQRARAAAVLRTRQATLRARGAQGISYHKMIVPEKGVVYAEYLPHALRGIGAGVVRPAQMLQQDVPGIVSYLDQVLIDAKSQGPVYFRADTHTSWLGAWFVYRAIIAQLAAAGVVLACPALRLGQLAPSMAAYDGDLLGQVDPALRRQYDAVCGAGTPAHGFELAIKFTIPDAVRAASPAEAPPQYRTWFPERETLAYQRPDGQGPRAVVFRDSTLDFCHDLLAQHFARTVFIWHQGLVYEDVIAQEAPDIVLHVMAERFVTRYPDVPPFRSVQESSLVTATSSVIVSSVSPPLPCILAERIKRVC